MSSAPSTVNVNTNVASPPQLDSEEGGTHEPPIAEVKYNSKHLETQVLPWSGKCGLLQEMGHFCLPSRCVVVQRHVLFDGPDHAEPTACKNAGDAVPKIEVYCGTTRNLRTATLLCFGSRGFHGGISPRGKHERILWGMPRRRREQGGVGKSSTQRETFPTLRTDLPRGQQIQSWGLTMQIMTDPRIFTQQMAQAMRHPW